VFGDDRVTCYTGAVLLQVNMSMLRAIKGLAWGTFMDFLDYFVIIYL